MWMTLPAAAYADAAGFPGETTSCAPGELVATMPTDGDTGVSPDAAIALVFEASRCGGVFFEGELSTELVGAVPFRIEVDGTLLRVVPGSPFAVGDTVRLVGQTISGPLDLSFTVGDEGLVMSGEPTAMEVEAEGHCEGLAFTTITGTVRFDAPASGLLQAAVLTEGLSGGWFTVDAVDGRAELGFTAEALGVGQEHCADARLLDETGAIVWQVAGDCATAAVCPAEVRTGDEATSGCSVTGDPRPTGALGLALALLLRRRR